MYKRALPSFLSFWLATATPAIAGSMTVSFINPETYTDASLSNGYGPKADQSTLAEIGRYLEGLGARFLKPGEILSLKVLNVDLAGKVEWWRRFAYDVRVLKDIYPPRFTINYSLVSGGRMLVEGQETVVDPNYLSNPGIYFSPNDPLRFEKAMLTNWFQSRFTVPSPAPVAIAR
jgi:hypothetical protein